MSDDFHNATRAKYGRFDLAFAHGVYYHSSAPGMFLENLLDLAETVFLGGFCATDDLPAAPWETWEYAGEAYRVKTYYEHSHFSAGVNRLAYFFHPQDLIKFYTVRNCQVTVISDEPSPVTAGNYLRLLIQA